jgi:MFS family permease
MPYIIFLNQTNNHSVLYSTSYTSGTTIIAEEFGQSETIVTLGLTFYLFGLAIGSMFMAPLSEVYGRKPVCVICLAVYTVLIIPCALAKSVTTLIVVRFIGAFFGSVMISTAPGMVADLVDDEHRALAISIWSIGPLNGPGMYHPLGLGFGFALFAANGCSHWSCHWRLCHRVSGLAMDVLDRTYSLSYCPGLCSHSQGNIRADPPPAKGSQSPQRKR